MALQVLPSTRRWPTSQSRNRRVLVPAASGANWTPSIGWRTGAIARDPIADDRRIAASTLRRGERVEAVACRRCSARGRRPAWLASGRARRGLDRVHLGRDQSGGEAVDAPQAARSCARRIAAAPRRRVRVVSVRPRRIRIRIRQRRRRDDATDWGCRCERLLVRSWYSRGRRRRALPRRCRRRRPGRCGGRRCSRRRARLVGACGSLPAALTGHETIV